MTIEEFRKIKPGTKLDIVGSEFIIREIIKFRLDDGNFYFKLFLNDDYIIADDEERGAFIFGKEIETPIDIPFPQKNIKFENKNFKFIFETGAVAEEIWGEEIFKKGYSEQFSDYEADDGSYLSLGYADDGSHRRLDLFGKVVRPDEVRIAA